MTVKACARHSPYISLRTTDKLPHLLTMSLWYESQWLKLSRVPLVLWDSARTIPYKKEMWQQNEANWILYCNCWSFLVLHRKLYFRNNPLLCWYRNDAWLLSLIFTNSAKLVSRVSRHDASSIPLGLGMCCKKLPYFYCQSGPNLRNVRRTLHCPQLYLWSISTVGPCGNSCLIFGNVGI